MDGAAELAELGRKLKGADKVIAKELRKALRDEVKPTIQDIRAYARAILPNRGGLADRVAAQKFGARTSFAAKGGAVKIVGAGMKSMKSIDAGKLRHPVFGNRKVWVPQSVTPGFFTGPIEDDLPKIREGIQRAMDRTAEQLT